MAGVIVRCRAKGAAPAQQVLTEIGRVLDRRSTYEHPPVTIHVSDAVALAIATSFAGATPSGLVMERFSRRRMGDDDALIAAARTEQGFATPEGHAALHCLIGWVQGRRYHERALLV